jgi:hypothetical protein
VVVKKEGRLDVVKLHGLGFPVTNKGGAVIELGFPSVLIWNRGHAWRVGLHIRVNHGR